MRADYLGLVAFVSIADHGSFQRGAEALNISQAALSHRLRKLEEDLGTALLIRSSREVSLTPTGQGLLPEARRILKELHDTYESVRVGSQKLRKTLSFACLPSLFNAYLPGVVADFGRENPSVAIDAHDIAVAQINERVRSGTVAFGITIVSAELSDLRLRPLVEEEYRLVVPRNHEFVRKGHVVRADLEGRVMARIQSQSKNRQLVDVALGEHLDRMSWKYEVQHFTTAMRLVAEGEALTILPGSAFRMAADNLVALRFTDTRLYRTLGIVTRRGVPLSEPAKDLLGRIEAHLLSMHDPDGPIRAVDARLPD